MGPTVHENSTIWKKFINSQKLPKKEYVSYYIMLLSALGFLCMGLTYIPYVGNLCAILGTWYLVTAPISSLLGIIFTCFLKEGFVRRLCLFSYHTLTLISVSIIFGLGIYTYLHS